ncbi:A-kinase anchor protein 12 [Bagarius yarrelli]|uniref:A-kinase anchor protein 12 n=1 Tax=Bagarius yarrelli TaxID=175774 RepID=A0A556V245_BAGYA|nr:A-kinase anchor protein 12 [Bagarius yarrelli]
MGASTSAQRDAKSAEEESAVTEERVADLSETLGIGCRDDNDDIEDAKLQKNGQISISSLNGKTDEQTELNGGDAEDTMAEVGQPETMPQKEGSPESIEVPQEEVSPQTNGEQDETCLVTAEETASTEEKVAEEKPTESNEVGFKKIFRFVGFKFTLKKDKKNEKIEPVQLLTVKETEDGASEAAFEETKEEPVTAEMQPEDEKKPDASETEKQASADDDAKAEAEKDIPVTDASAETKADGPEETEKTHADKPAEDIETSAEKEKEPGPQAESPTSPPSQETQSPFRRFFTQGIFSNLRKKTSFKKSKEEEPVKEKSAEEDIKEDEEKEEKEEVAAEVEGQVKQDEKEVETEEQVEKETEASPEETSSTSENQKEKEVKVEVETKSEAAPAQEPEAVKQTTICEVSEAPASEEKDETKPTDDLKPTDDKTSDSSDEQQTSAETTTEAQSPQDKAKAQGSPLKKLFTGAGLKKLSSKKQKGKKEPELKQTESTEQAAEQIQSSSESGEAQKPDSDPSSPDESGEHVVGETSQAEANVETEGEATTSDSEKKKDGILHWASFKKLVTPKKRVKRPSDSEDETPGDKPKSATLSSTESAVFEEKTEEIKASDEVKEEAKEESQVECKTETKAEKSEQSTEEPKKKIDTSVSWEALICVGSTKKRARKTSDSDDEETKIEEEVQQSGEEQAKTVESPIESSQEAERENVTSSPEPEGELVSTWESFKRLVTHRKKPKPEDKSDEAQGPEQTVSDSELPKEESSFSLRKLIPRRKKKSDMKLATSDVGSAEEDSDTPAVVPLSEYDNEQSEMATEEEKKTEQAKPEVTPVTPVTPGKASAEDRSPSWISATVENVEDEADGKPLSDIPEEGDTAATPKSTDNTIAEDIVEFTSEAVTATEPAEETEMVSALSRITESPDTSGEASPVPDDGVVKKTEAILQEAVETISVTSSAVTVTVAKQQTNSMAVSTIPFQMESAIKEEKVVLAVHQRSEATAICTSLDTSEIKAVEEETPLTATVEAISTVSDAVSVEVATEDQTLKPDEVEVVEEKVFVAQVNKVQTQCKEEPPASVEHTIEDNIEIQTTCESQEETAIKVEVPTPIQQETEILEQPVVAEDTLKVVAETTVEPSVCAQTVITEITATVEVVQELKDVTESVASAEVESAEVAVAVPKEVTTSLPDTLVDETIVSQENFIPAHVATQEIVVTEEIVCVCPPSESKTEADQVVIDSVLTSQVYITTNVEVVSNEEESRREGEKVEAMQLKEAEAIQEQSTVIVQEVIQNVVENLSEIHMEPELEEQPVEEKSEEAPVLNEECTINTQIQEETKPETENKAEEEPRQIITENLPISEADQDAVAEEIKPQVDKEASSASVEAAQLCTEEAEQEVELKKSEIKPQVDKEASSASVEAAQLCTEEAEQEVELKKSEIKPQVDKEASSASVEAAQLCTEEAEQEVELKKSEKAVEEDKMVTTESEDGKCQVEKDQNEVPSETTETPALDESSPTQSASLESSKNAVITDESQQPQEMKMETSIEINVGNMHMADKDERATQDTEITVQEESTKSQEPSKDEPQTDLEEAQKDISAPDMKGQKGSEDPDCQKTDAEASEVKTVAEETPKSSKEEDAEKEIDSITTES